MFLARYSGIAGLSPPSHGKTLYAGGKLGLRSLCVSSFIIILVAGFFSGLSAQSGSDFEPLDKNVLVLHAFESNVPIFELTDRGVREALDAGGVDIRQQFFEYLDLARNPDPDHMQKLVELMRLRYGHRRIDVVITMYAEALRFLLHEGSAIFPDVPVLALWLPAGFERPKTDRRIIRHIPRREILRTFEFALRLFPQSRHVYVVAGTHETDRGAENQARRELKGWENRLEFRYLSGMPFEEILTTVARAPAETVVLILPFTTDVTGRIFTLKEVTRRVSRASAAPTFGLYEFLLGQGIVGGSLLSYEQIGCRAGELALEILRGGMAGEHIPEYLDVPSVPMFDWQQLRRWHVAEDALPEGSKVINREFVLWDFRFYILGALAFVIAQSLLIAGLLINRRRRRSAEVSLRQKTEELARFFNVSLDLLCIASTQGSFLLLNPAWEKVLGYTREELMAKRFLDFVHPDDLDRSQEALSALMSQQKVVHFENRYRSKDGTYRWLEWTSAPAGELIYAAARDLSERLKAEAEDQQRREELAHLTRVAMMGELTASLAHEINQPLTAILSNAEAARQFLSLAAPDIDEVRQILDDIIRDDKRAGEVVRKVRALVKKEKLRLEPLDLNGLIQEVVVLIRGDSLLRGLSIAMDLRRDLPTICGDHIQLQQVIINLILNGAAAMNNTSAGQRMMIVRTGLPDSGTVKVSVTDYGTGIDQNQIHRLFEPFYTTKPQGLGMGLSISRTIIRSHGGTLEASNNPEGGATFSFTLPACGEEPS